MLSNMLTKEKLRAQEGEQFPGKTYVEDLLKPVYNDQRDYLFHTMFQIHRAHVMMLLEQEILTKEQARNILQAVEDVSQTDPSTLSYDPSYEDLFFQMEEKIADKIGKELAGNMHIARSRNDMGVTMYRYVLRERLLNLLQHVLELRDAVLEFAQDHVETIMPAYTHTQPAQPTTLGHYLTAVHDLLARDTTRLWNAYRQVNQSPLGAAAITTTGFPIDRDSTKTSLGFAGLVENSYDAVAGADYLLETATAVLVLMSNTGRWLQDFLQLCTREFQAFRVAAPYVQTSSIMPQKRNPVSIEHSRSIASSAVGDAQAAITMMHNTPFGDIVDTEDDLQPHLYSAMEKAKRVMRLMTVVIRTMEVNREHLLKKSREAYITITELSDALVREKGLSLRQAHKLCANVARTGVAKGMELDEFEPEVFERIAREELGINLQLSSEELKRYADPRTFIEVRRITGGPNFEETRRMIRVRRSRLEARWNECTAEIRFLEDQDQKLKRRIQELIG